MSYQAFGEERGGCGPRRDASAAATATTAPSPTPCNERSIGASADSLCAAELRSDPLERGGINVERNFAEIKDSEWGAGLIPNLSIAIAKIVGQVEIIIDVC
jgi:hypothetical protein